MERISRQLNSEASANEEHVSYRPFLLIPVHSPLSPQSLAAFSAGFEKALSKTPAALSPCAVGGKGGMGWGNKGVFEGFCFTSDYPPSDFVSNKRILFL